MKKVLIVGGGLAGTATATALRKKDKLVEIVLVEPKDYIAIYWAAYRALFDSKVADESNAPISLWATKHNVQWIPSIVTTLTETHATLDNGQVIDDFDIAVICTGSVNPWQSLGRKQVLLAPPPTTTTSETGTSPTSKRKGIITSRKERLKQLEQDGKKLLDEPSIVVVGGGLVGVETAGDLAYYASQHNKPLQVTLVHSGERLVPEFPKRPAEQVANKLSNLGVKVILGDKVVPVHHQNKNRKNASGNNNKNNSKSPPSKAAATSYKLLKSNEPITAKKIIWTTGITPQNSTFLDTRYLDGKGWIKVDDYFRLMGADSTVGGAGIAQNNSNRLFALGDCCDLFPNSGSQVLGAMHMIAYNIKVALDYQGNPEMIQKKMKRALSKPEIYVATIGKKTGVAVTPVINTQFILPGIKNSTMFLFKPHKDLGLSKESMGRESLE